MSAKKHPEYKKGFQAGYQSGLKADGKHAHGRTMGKRYRVRQVEEHLSGEVHHKWVHKLLEERELREAQDHEQPIENNAG